MTSRYGPQEPCQRTVCATRPPHLGGVHLDPASELWDGPDAVVGALGAGPRRAAQTILADARGNRTVDQRAIEAAVHTLVEEIHRLKDQVTAVRVDRDRGIREALRRAEDCAAHGEALRHEGHQAHWFSVLAARNDDERAVWVDACYRIREAFAERGDELARKVIAFLDAAGRDADRARKRHPAPTLADCQRAAHCEHPAWEPHEACRQLTKQPGPPLVAEVDLLDLLEAAGQATTTTLNGTAS